MSQHPLSRQRQMQSGSFSIPGFVALGRLPSWASPISTHRSPSVKSSIASTPTLQDFDRDEQAETADSSPARRTGASKRIQAPQLSSNGSQNDERGESKAQSTTRHGVAVSDADIDDESAWVCAVAERNETNREIGVALVNVSLGVCTIGSFSDTQMCSHLLHLLDVYEPHRVLVSASRRTDHLGKSLRSALQELLHEFADQRGHIEIQALPQTTFSDEKGKYFIDAFLLEDEIQSDKIGDNISILSTRHTRLQRTSFSYLLCTELLAVSAAGALFSHLQDHCHLRIQHKTICFRLYHPEGTVMIDHKTIRELELVQNALTGKVHGSLLGIMNYCATPMGSRLLRLNILQPLAGELARSCSAESDKFCQADEFKVAPEDIVFRLDAIDDLKANPERYLKIRDVLKGFGSKKIDAEKVVSAVLSRHRPARPTERKIANGVQHGLRHIIHIYHFLECISALAQDLSGAGSPLLQALKAHIGSGALGHLQSCIYQYINEDILAGNVKSSLSSTNTRLYAVKNGGDSILDAARQTYQENTADAMDKCQSYCETYNLPFQARFSATGHIGYHLELDINAIKQRNIPREFIDIRSSRNTGRKYKLTTLDLKKCNQRISDVMNEVNSLLQVLLLSEALVEKLCSEIATRAQELYRASEALAFLDVIFSFTHFIGSGHYVRPYFGDELAIKKGRHPLLDRNNHEGTIPNDTHLSSTKNFMLLTGANNSGKTTYLKQVALLQLMARIGCFVPAERATFAPLRRILARMSNTDEPEANLSAYANEIKATLAIINMAGPDSLVLIDELGRNTSTHEGLGIAHAVSEVLIGRSVPTILSTHFVQLVTTLSTYPSVTTQHFKVGVFDDTEHRHANFVHCLGDRIEESVGYGLTIAHASGLPLHLLEDAGTLAKRLRGDLSGEGAVTKEDCFHDNTTHETQRLGQLDKSTKYPTANFPWSDGMHDLNDTKGFEESQDEFFYDFHFDESEYGSLDNLASEFHLDRQEHMSA